METRKERAPPAPSDLAAPLTGWEAVARWNRSTFDWMATSWQQWLALVTTMPSQWLVPPEVGPAPSSVTPASRTARSSDGRAAASPEPKRPAPKKKSAAQGRKRG